MVWHAEGNVEALLEDKNAAEEYLSKEAQFYCVKINLLKYNKNKCKENVKTLQEVLDGLEKKKDYEKQKLVKKQEELKELEVCTCASNHPGCGCSVFSLRPSWCIHSL